MPDRNLGGQYSFENRGRRPEVISLLGLLACTEPTTDKDSRPPPPDFQMTEVDRDSYKSWDYKVQTYSLHPKAKAPYDSLFANTVNEDGTETDHRPSFYLLRPKDSTTQPPAVLFYLHGGTIADDRDFPSTGNLPDACQRESVLGLSKDKIDQQLMPLSMAAERGWLVVVPRNDWCDYWLGHGSADPQATWHYGGTHFERVLNFLEDGHAGIDLPDRRFLWGSSAGGGAAAHLAVRHGGFEAIVADSSPSDLFELYLKAPEALAFQFGGPPFEENGEKSEFWQAYAEASAHTLIASASLKTPLFLLWNTMDQRVNPAHAQSLIDAMKSHYDPFGIAWGSKDLNHPSPGEHFHVQGNRPSLPAAAAAFAMLEFLTGADLMWVEAENGCGDAGEICTVGQDIALETDSPESISSLSQAQGRQVFASEGPGVLWSAPVPTELPADQELVVQAIFKVTSESTLPSGTVLGKLILHSDLQRIEILLQTDDLAPAAQARRTEVIGQLRATRLSFERVHEEQAVLELEVTGVADLILDAVIFSTAPSAAEFVD